jgi:hypothetical protein
VRKAAERSGPSKLRECPAAGLCDAKADDLDRAPTGDHALGLRYREPGGDQLDQHVDREPVGEHDGLSAAVAVMFEQFERATAGGGRSKVSTAIAASPDCLLVIGFQASVQPFPIDWQRRSGTGKLIIDLILRVNPRSHLEINFLGE